MVDLSIIFCMFQTTNQPFLEPRAFYTSVFTTMMTSRNPSLGMGFPIETHYIIHLQCGRVDSYELFYNSNQYALCECL